MNYIFEAVQEKKGELFCKKNDHILRILWGEGHTLVCQDFTNTVTTKATDGTIEMIFTFPDEFTGNKEDFEISFYWDANGESDFSVDGKKANTFTLGQSIQLIKSNMRFRFTFEKIGEGSFFGHLLKGNRPSQILKTPFTAYDWRLALRTLNRSPGCQIRVLLQCSAI